MLALGKLTNLKLRETPDGDRLVAEVEVDTLTPAMIAAALDNARIELAITAESRSTPTGTVIEAVRAVQAASVGAGD